MRTQSVPLGAGNTDRVQHRAASRSKRSVADHPATLISPASAFFIDAGGAGSGGDSSQNL
jgi:DeoR/GlpR family transcriptional regulator of sugar metabolism